MSERVVPIVWAVGAAAARRGAGQRSGRLRADRPARAAAAHPRPDGWPAASSRCNARLIEREGLVRLVEVDLDLGELADGRADRCGIELEDAGERRSAVAMSPASAANARRFESGAHLVRRRAARRDHRIDRLRLHRLIAGAAADLKLELADDISGISAARRRLRRRQRGRGRRPVAACAAWIAGGSRRAPRG